jgi:D-glycero-D-manno-heptose 1,7-bisphosphate phosphatase
MKAVIMAGGRGTRLASIAHDIPKPMVPVGGMPVLEFELQMLREQA